LAVVFQMAKGRSSVTVTAEGRNPRAWSPRARKSFILAFAAVVAIKLVAVAWALLHAGPALVGAAGAG
jgi:hypothetical protein